MTPALPPALESELAALRADPIDAIGFGDKAYMPYELRRGRTLASAAEPEVTARLVTEANDTTAPLAYRQAILHVLAHRDDPAVDAALSAALADRGLRPVAAYLLGRIDFKGYPRRTRTTAPLLAALRAHLDDAGQYDDPWYRKRFAVQDFVLGAYVRLAGAERFTFPHPDLADAIGHDLPEWTDDDRRALLDQAKRLPVP